MATSDFRHSAFRRYFGRDRVCNDIRLHDASYEFAEPIIERKRGRKPKSGFYHARWNKVGINQARAAEILGVTIEEVESFDQLGNPLAERYLLLWDQKHIRHPEWNGWLFTRGRLSFKNKHSFSPEYILSAEQTQRRVYELENEIKKLKSPLGLLRTAFDLLKKPRFRIQIKFG